MTAARDAVIQSPEGNAIREQIAGHRQQQGVILREYKEANLAPAQAHLNELLPEHNLLEEGHEVASDQDVKSALKPSAAVEKNTATQLKVAEQNLRRDLGAAAYQPYQDNAKLAAQEFKMRPQIIPDEAKRAQGMALKEEMAELKAKIAHYDKEMGDLEKGKVGARLRSLASGGTEGRKEFYEQKKAAAQQQLASLEKQLDQVAHESISPSTKLNLVQDARELAQGKAQAKVEGVQPEGNNIIIEEKKEEQAAHKPSVGEILKRSHSMPSLGPQVDQQGGLHAKKDAAKDKSVRASGSWQPAKPPAATAGGIKQI
jgi:hypothetical protein